jgi:hypothetical protein
MIAMSSRETAGTKWFARRAAIAGRKAQVV